MGNIKRVEPITAQQMGELARLLKNCKVGRELFQESLEGDGPNRLAAFLKNDKYYPEKAELMAILRIMGRNSLSPNQVLPALQKKGINIDLTQEEKAQSQQIPWSKSLLREIAEGSWRGKRAILWWAPPKRYRINIVRFRKIFNINLLYYGYPDYRVYKTTHWLEEKFAKEVVSEGWHLTLVGIPDETRQKNYDPQKALMTKNEILVKPVELVFLTLLNYEINKGQRLFKNDCSGTDTLNSSGCVVQVGRFDEENLTVGGYSYPHCCCSPNLGLVFSRRFD